MKEVYKKNNLDIEKEWDNIALLRNTQIKNKVDVSFHKILVPNIIEQLKYVDNISEKKLIDLGCGSGYLTNILSSYVKEAVGVDISSKNIEIAKKNFSKPNLHFYKSAIEHFKGCDYEIAVSNMVLMDVINLERCVKSISDLLQKNSTFIFSITHPQFWPKYWGYEDMRWFDYSREIIIESNFKITNENTTFKTTHIHRPLENYLNLLAKYNFEAKNIVQLPNINEDIYPRFWIGNFKFKG